ncbi:ABC transporter permease [Candidatus Poribacteria bacterium]|nr:ABC transporter permease [Candidatus Poribacteria bacterium]
MYTRAKKVLFNFAFLYFAPILFSFGLCSILFLIVGASPIFVYIKLLFGAFESPYWFSELILKITPLLLCSLAVMTALKVNFWNIGVEGQFCIGAWAAGGTAMALGWMPGYFLLPILALSGFICGILWISLPVIMKLRLKVNEIITTLLMNYIGILWLNHFIYGKWKGSDGFPYTKTFSNNASLPGIFGQRAHIGIFFGLVLVAGLYFMFGKTRFGYKSRVVGENAKAGLYGGINIIGVVLINALISGGLAGFAGMVDITGIHHRLHPNIILGYGYTALIITWLAKNNPIHILVVSVLFGILAVGGDMIQVYQVPNAIVKILQGVIFLSILTAEGLYNKFRILDSSI